MSDGTIVILAVVAAIMLVTITRIALDARVRLMNTKVRELELRLAAEKVEADRIENGGVK